MAEVKADVVVIGGGIVGASAALRLAQRGRQVVLLERERVGEASSGRAGGGVRQQYRHPAELPLAMGAVEIWAGLAAELGQDLEYVRRGNVKLLRTEEELVQARERVTREKAQGLEVHLLDAQETRKLVPTLSPNLELFGGTFCPSDGTANPLVVTKAIGRAAARQGVDVRTHEPVLKLTESGGRVIGAVTARATYRAEHFVLAAGAWAEGLCQTLGLGFPVRFMKAQILVTEPLPPVIRGFISFDNGYLRQALAGNIHIGVRGTPTEELETSLPFQAFANGGRHFPEVFPFLGKIRIIRGFAGLTTWPPDGIPVIDRAPGLEGLLLAAGFSGHGFCLGPMVGRLLAEWIVDGRPCLDLSPFAWTRFRDVHAPASAPASEKG